MQWTGYVAVAVFLIMLIGISKLPKKKFSFAVRVLMGSGAGMVFGLLLWFAGEQGYDLENEMISWIALVGDGFLYLFQMLLGVAILTATIHLILHTPIEDAKDPWKQKRKHVAALMVFLSATVSMITAILLGAGKMPGSFGSFSALEAEIPSLIANFIPVEWVNDVMLTKVVAIVAAGWFIGIAARRMAVKKAELIAPFSSFVNAFFEILVSVCKAVIAYKPVGAAAITAFAAACEGPKVIVIFAWFIAVLIIAILVMFVLQLIVMMFHGVSPVHFLRDAKDLIRTAAVTHSGAGCVEPAISLLVEKFDVEEATAREVVPYTMSSGMQGCAAAFPAVVFVFVLNQSGVSISPVMLVLAAVVIMVDSFGITGLPGTATMAEFGVVLSMPLSLSLHFVGPAVALDPVADVFRTPLNVTGVMANAIWIDRAKKKKGKQ